MKLSKIHEFFLGLVAIPFANFVFGLIVFLLLILVVAGIGISWSIIFPIFFDLCLLGALSCLFGYIFFYPFCLISKKVGYIVFYSVAGVSFFLFLIGFILKKVQHGIDYDLLSFLTNLISVVNQK